MTELEDLIAAQGRDDRDEQAPERYYAETNGKAPQVHVLSLNGLAEQIADGGDEDTNDLDPLDAAILAPFNSREAYRASRVPRIVEFVAVSFHDIQLLGHRGPCWKCGERRDLKTPVRGVDSEQLYGAPWTGWRVLVLCSRCFARSSGRTIIEGRCVLHGADDVYFPPSRTSGKCRACVRQLMKRSRSNAADNDVGSASGSASIFLGMTLDTIREVVAARMAEREAEQADKEAWWSSRRK